MGGHIPKAGYGYRVQLPLDEDDYLMPSPPASGDQPNHFMDLFGDAAPKSYGKSIIDRNPHV